MKEKTQTQKGLLCTQYCHYYCCHVYGWYQLSFFVTMIMTFIVPIIIMTVYACVHGWKYDV